jgi:hypothetical protein
MTLAVAIAAMIWVRRSLRPVPHHGRRRLGREQLLAVRGPFPSWNRSILTEIYLCHACSYHEIEDGNGPDRELLGKTLSGLALGGMGVLGAVAAVSEWGLYVAWLSVYYLPPCPPAPASVCHHGTVSTRYSSLHSH